MLELILVDLSEDGFGSDLFELVFTITLIDSESSVSVHDCGEYLSISESLLVCVSDTGVSFVTVRSCVIESLIGGSSSKNLVDFRNFSLTPLRLLRSARLAEVNSYLALFPKRGSSFMLGKDLARYV